MTNTEETSIGMQTEGGQQPLVYTVPECARLLRVSENHVYNLIKQGNIPSLRFGKLIRVPQWALLQHLSAPRVAIGADPSVHVTDQI